MVFFFSFTSTSNYIIRVQSAYLLEFLKHKHLHKCLLKSQTKVFFFFFFFQFLHLLKDLKMWHLARHICFSIVYQSNFQLLFLLYDNPKKHSKRTALWYTNSYTQFRTSLSFYERMKLKLKLLQDLFWIHLITAF